MEDDLDIAAIRRALGMSQTKFAEFVGVDSSTVSLWESRKRLPRAPTRKLIERLFLERRQAAE